VVPSDDKALPQQLAPQLLHAVDLEVLLSDPEDLDGEHRVG
jgi:hypothetical protein